MMRKSLLALGCLALASPAAAQQARIVTSCGALAPFGSQSAGGSAFLTQDVNGNLCSSATASVGSVTLGTVKQGAPDVTAAPWQMALYQSGSPIGAGNGLYVQPGASTTWTISGNVGITGTLPAFTTTPTVNIGAGQTIGISGTLPAFTAPPTFNLGTLNGAATAANQTTANASLATIASNTGAPIPAGTNQIGYLSGLSVGSGAIATGQVSCGTSSTALVSARTGAPGTGRINITITNLGTTSVAIGGNVVTTSTGEVIPGIAGASLTLSTTAAIYCAASSAQSVSYVENF